MTEKLTSPVRTWQLWLAFIGAIGAAGAAWGSSQAQLQSNTRRLDKVEDAVHRTERNIVRIGAELGVRGIENP